MTGFNAFSLHESILNEIKQKGYTNPTPIQEKSIPLLLKGHDLIAIAQTGTGKTAAFSLPMIHKFGSNKVKVAPKCTRSLILTPTRELALQIEENIENYAKGLDLKTAVVYGGARRSDQVAALEQGLDILVATPGRLIDLINNGDANFSQLEVFVLDEADTMLDMGFQIDVHKIIEKLPSNRQTVLFSATMPTSIEKLADDILDFPLKVEVTPESSTSELVEQKVCHVEKANKTFLLYSILENKEFETVLIFCKTKFGTDIVAEELRSASIPAESIHSKRTQREREAALQGFKDGKVRVLVATDVASRGIDVKDISLVINYNLPEDPRNYVHRIGRTARAGKRGVAISFVVQNDLVLLKSIEKSTGEKIPVDHNQPFHKELDLSNKKKKKKKPKKKF